MSPLEQKTEAIEAQKRRAAQQKDDLEWLMKEPQGRRFLNRFFAEARKECFTGEANTSFYNQGRASLARSIIDLMRSTSMVLYQQVEREANEEQTHG